ncbi:MAG: hypothetical protein JSU63_02325 [Phycisphaerales bacterium]|nr:MAG: hypothetical protein JSU63_02325 [Phycisphaerales bacterium]
MLSSIALAALPLGIVFTGQMAPLAHLDTLSQGLEAPARLAVTGSEILVTDPQANTVVRFDLATGTYIGTWTEPAGPVGIAVHPDGRIFVSRRDDGQVGVYDSSFVFQHALDASPFVVEGATDLAMDAVTGSLYVADSAADRYYVFGAEESLVRAVGSRGGSSGQFRFPSSIAIDTANDLVVVGDQDNFRGQLFDLNGMYMRRFGYRTKYISGGLVEGWFARSAGIAFDQVGRIYVVDALMDTLRVFTSAGAELGKVVDHDASPGGLRTPTDVVIDASGRVLVANSGTGSVEIFAPPPASRDSEGTFFTGTNVSGQDRNSKLRGARSRIDQEVPVEVVDGGSGDGMPSAARGGWDPPHVLADVSCGRCHDVDGQPGGHVGLAEGQAQVCFSCHTGGGQAPGSLVRPTTNLGMSHAWGVDAVNAAYGSVGPPAGSELELYLENGLIKCATCHDQHSQDIAAPYLRMNSTQLCRSCHSEHIIHTPQGDWQPVCTDCHAPHDPDDRNLSLVAGGVFNQTLGIEKPVVLTSRSGANSFADGDGTYDGICEVCHTETTFHKHDGSGGAHNEGVTCTGCHAHADGFMASGACDACHGAPPATGAHLVHFGVNDLGLVSYGGTDNVSTAAAYGFQCGTCHPLSFTAHMNGSVDVELYDAAAPAGSLKSMSPPAAAYSEIDSTCSNVYCHSRTDWSSSTVGDPLTDPVEGWALLDSNGNLTYDPYTVTEFPVYSTVSWSGASLDCNGCHRNPPQTQYPNVYAAVGNSHAAVDDWGYENLHNWNMSFDPLFCRVCHYSTVTDAMTWTRIAGDITLFDDVAIADKRYHVNGAKDVAFDPVNAVTYSSQTFTFESSIYDPADKTCSNVGCHLEQCKPAWGKPYRWGWGSLECDQCHHYGGPWPPTSPCDTLPRAGRDFDTHGYYPGMDCGSCHARLPAIP